MQVERRGKAGIVILTCDEIDFNTKAIVRNKEGHHIMIKGIIQQKYIH